jgi:hypothetical protein
MKVCAVPVSSPWISAQVMYVRPSCPIVTSPNWMSWSEPLIRIGLVQFERSAEQRTALMLAVKPAAFAFVNAKSE